MRGATECAKRLKLFLSGLRSKLGKVSPPAVSDPVTQLVLGVLSRDTPESKAHEGLDRLRAMVVDYNELRVIPAIELAEVLDDFPDARLKCEDISRALNRIFAREHAITLERVEALSKKDQAAYLDALEGLEPYTRARMRLLGFNQHAIPLDAAMWELARREELIAPKCDLDESQRFFERQIKEGEALEFVALFKKQAWAECAAAVRAGEVARIHSIPPDRTSRNMLAAVVASTAGRDADIGELELDVELEEPPDDPELVAAPSDPPATAKRTSRARRSARPSRAPRAAGDNAATESKPARDSKRPPAKPTAADGPPSRKATRPERPARPARSRAKR